MTKLIMYDYTLQIKITIFKVSLLVFSNYISFISIKVDQKPEIPYGVYYFVLKFFSCLHLFIINCVNGYYFFTLFVDFNQRNKYF